MMERAGLHAPKISLRDVLFIVFSKIHILIGTFLVTVGITFVYCLRAAPVYEAGGTVLIKPFFDSRQQLNSAGRFDVLPVTQQDINTEIKIMYSRKLMLRVVKELGMDEADEPSFMKKMLIQMGISFQADPMDAAVDYLQENMEIIPITMSNIILVLMKGKNPEGITKIVNTFLTFYIDHHIEVYKSGGGLDFYSEQTELASKKLIEAETALKDFQKKWMVIDVERQNDYNLKLMQILKEKLSLTRSAIAEKQIKLSQLKNDFAKFGELTAMTQEIRESELLVQLSKGLIPLLVEKERIALLYPENSVEYQHNSRQVERFRQEMRKEQDQLIKGLEYDLNAMTREAGKLETEIQEIETESRILTEREIERRKLLREVEINKKNYELYQAKTEEARINDQRDASRVANVSINGWAQKPSIPVYPRKKKMLLISMLVGFMAGIGASFAGYYLDHSVKTPEDLSASCDVPVFGSLKVIRKAKKKHFA